MIHQHSSMTSIGTVDLPAPRKIAAIQCEYASGKKNGVVVRHAARHKRWIPASLVKKTDQRRGEAEDQQRDGFGDDCRAADAEPDALLHAVILFRAEVLADERGQRHGEAGDGQEAEAPSMRL